MNNQSLEPLRSWLKKNSISTALYYTMAEEDRPPTVKIGNKIFVVLDQVPAWTAKITAKGQVTTSRSATHVAA